MLFTFLLPDIHQMGDKTQRFKNITKLLLTNLLVTIKLLIFAVNH
jgi:hypothetical protein